MFGVVCSDGLRCSKRIKEGCFGWGLRSSLYNGSYRGQASVRSLSEETGGIERGAVRKMQITDDRFAEQNKHWGLLERL